MKEVRRNYGGEYKEPNIKSKLIVTFKQHLPLAF